MISLALGVDVVSPLTPGDALRNASEPGNGGDCDTGDCMQPLVPQAVTCQKYADPAWLSGSVPRWSPTRRATIGNLVVMPAFISLVVKFWSCATSRWYDVAPGTGSHVKTGVAGTPAQT